MTRSLFTAVLTLIMAGPLVSADKSEPRKVKVGDKAPAFKLRNHDGKDLTLEQALKQKKFVAIVFYRSASW